MKLDVIHPNVSNKLLVAFSQCGGSVLKLEKALKVNRYYIFQLLKYGKEPTDKTVKGKKARVRLFLPVRKRRGSPVVVSEYVKEWRKLPKEERNHVIETYIKWKRNNPKGEGLVSPSSSSRNTVQPSGGSERQTGESRGSHPGMVR